MFVCSKQAFSCMKFVRRSPGVVQVYQGTIFMLFIRSLFISNNQHEN